jgi:hypothetical protein
MWQPPECIILVVDKNMCFRKDIDIENALKLVCLDFGEPKLTKSVTLKAQDCACIVKNVKIKDQ